MFVSVFYFIILIFWKCGAPLPLQALYVEGARRWPGWCQLRRLRRCGSGSNNNSGHGGGGGMCPSATPPIRHAHAYILAAASTAAAFAAERRFPGRASSTTHARRILLCGGCEWPKPSTTSRAFAFAVVDVVVAPSNERGLVRGEVCLNQSR